MTANTMENYEDDINNLDKEMKCIRKQINEVESMLWALDEQHKEYHQLLYVQANRDTRYIALFVLMNLFYLWWIS
jgi:archaellum component FlaC